MRRGVELADIENVALILENGSLVVVDIKIIGCREQSHDRWEARGSCLAVHAVPMATKSIFERQGECVSTHPASCAS